MTLILHVSRQTPKQTLVLTQPYYQLLTKYPQAPNVIYNVVTITIVERKNLKKIKK